MHSPEERLQTLLEASELLSSSIDYETTLANLPRVLVPRLADGCVIDLVGSDESVERMGVALADPAQAEIGERLKQLRPADPRAVASVLRVVEEGRARLMEELPEQGTSGAYDPEHVEILRELGLRSGMVVPMLARGRSIGLLWMYSLGTDRRYGPEDLALAEDLGRRAAMAIDNARLYAEAQAAIRSRDVFLTVASHELRTPLTALQIQVHSVRRLAARAAGQPGPAPGDTSAPPRSAERQSLERIAAKIEVAARQVARLTRLVDDLLDVSQIGAGRLRLRVEPVDLVTLVREVLIRLEGQLAQAKCKLELRVDEVLVGNWDRSRLDQVIVNLLSNAMKYGAGKPIEIDISGSASGARLCVRDHGIGIAPEDQARIFERFERAVSARQYAGLGMGLWIVRKIVAAHGGSIRVDSRPGAGATFTVELPLKAPAWASVERRLEPSEGA